MRTARDGLIHGWISFLFEEAANSVDRHYQIFPFIRRMASNSFSGNVNGEEAQGYLTGLFPTKTPTTYGRAQSPELGMRVSHFGDLHAQGWLSDVHIANFLTNLAWMQVPEVYPRPGFMVRTRSEPYGTLRPHRFYERRLLKEGDPKAYVMKIDWFTALRRIVNGGWTNVQAQAAPEPLGQYSFEIHVLAETIRESNDPVLVHQDYVFEFERSLLRSNTPTERSSLTRAGRQSSVRETIYDPTQYHSVIFPVNFDDFHWTTVVVDNITMTIHFYDLLNARDDNHNRIQQFQTEAMDSVEFCMNYARQMRQLPRMTYQRHRVVTTQLQEDGWNCGVHTCMIGWLTAFQQRAPTFAELQEMDWGNEEMKSVREWIGYSILKARIWTPPTAESTIDAIQCHHFFQDPRDRTWDWLFSQEIPRDPVDVDNVDPPNVQPRPQLRAPDPDEIIEIDDDLDGVIEVVDDDSLEIPYASDGDEEGDAGVNVNADPAGLVVVDNRVPAGPAGAVIRRRFDDDNEAMGRRTRRRRNRWGD
jgi:hypothetical protein